MSKLIINRVSQWSLFLVVMFSLIACGSDDSNDNEPNEQAFNVSLYVGTYKGTWTNNTTGATGSAQLDIIADETYKTATLTLDFGGKYLGIDDPPPATLTGTYSDAGAVVKGKSDLFGEYDVTIDPDGDIVGVMKQLADGAIPEMTYTGKLTKDTLEADYVVKFADGTVANSILRMQKQ